jgi:hypothetical protein
MNFVKAIMKIQIGMEKSVPQMIPPNAIAK